jgi:haloalkane dehalogenase
VLLMHGEPTWSYLYRHVIAALKDRFRVVAPDLVGFGRSDKPADVSDYSYENHVGWMLAGSRRWTCATSPSSARIGAG